MKRLWMRLGLVAGILGVGGAGVLVAQRSGSPSAEPAAVASAPAESTENNNQPRPIPLSGTSMSPASPVSATNVAVYSNELEPEDASSSARFVEPPAPSQFTPSQYASSPTAYSINDAEDGPAPIPTDESAAAPQSSYAPASGYASRYGDPVGDDANGGAALRSPQTLAETQSQSAGNAKPASEYETPARPTPMTIAATEPAEAERAATCRRPWMAFLR